jgi:hypothetical protein
VALPNGLGYAKGRYISSFIGYLPADKPEVLIAVKIDEPSEAIFGGVVAAPSFSKLALFCCDHLKITPTHPKQMKNVSPGAADGSKPAKKSTKDASKDADKEKSGTPRRDAQQRTKGASAEVVTDESPADDSGR